MLKKYQCPELISIFEAENYYIALCYMVKSSLHLFIIFSFYSFSAVSQHLPNDTVSVADSCRYEDGMSISDFELVDSLYKNIWNNAQIKYGITMVSKQDTIAIALSGKDRYFHSCQGKVISKFGRRGRRQHTGTDIKLQHGDSVHCVFNGRVRMAQRLSGYGNMVVVRHNNGLETLYSHLSAIKVSVNDTLRAGDLIGLGGRTGRATTEHLHFETRVFGEPFDSSIYIDFETGKLKTDTVYYHNHQLVANLADLTKKSTAKTVSAANGESVHIVQSGDSLWRIAQKYGTSVSKICTDNNISTKQILKIGSQLRIL